MEKDELLKNMYEPVFNHFAEEKVHDEVIPYDEAWENSGDKDIMTTFESAKNDGLYFKENKNKVSFFDPDELIEDVARGIQADYCERELRKFYARVQKVIDRGVTNLEGILQAACYEMINGRNTKMNYFEAGVRIIKDNGLLLEKSLDNYDDFKKVIGYDDNCLVKVQKYVNRYVPNNEQQLIDFKYIAGSPNENILRSYDNLSSVSKLELINKAKSAYNVYYELSKAGMSISDMEANKELVGLGMYIEWLKNNKPNYAVNYEEISSSIKEENMIAFDKLLEVVKKDKNYKISPVDNYSVPDYLTIEKELIEKINNPKLFGGVFKKKDKKIVEKAVNEVINEEIEKEEHEVSNIDYGKRGFAGMWLLGLATGLMASSLIAFAAYFFGK